MILRLFNYDSKFMHKLNRIADVMILYIIYLVCCIPLITIGPATISLYYTINKLHQNKETNLVSKFFTEFKTDFGKKLIVSVYTTIIVVALYMDGIILISYVYGSSYSNLVLIGMIGVYVLVCIIINMIISVLFPVVSRILCK